MNYRGYYIGPEFSYLNVSDNKYLALYQVAAKLQEVLCVASLTTVVLQVLRYDLLYGDGALIGLLGSDISFGSISYFWSPILPKWHSGRLLANCCDVCRRKSYLFVTKCTAICHLS